VTTHNPTPDTPTSTPQPTNPRADEPTATPVATLDAVSALLAQASTDATPPTWLPAAASAVADWHETHSPTAARIAELTKQLATIRRDVRGRVVTAVADGEVGEYAADDALRGWGLDPIGPDELRRLNGYTD
jgi:hypothetical protein